MQDGGGAELDEAEGRELECASQDDRKNGRAHGVRDEIILVLRHLGLRSKDETAILRDYAEHSLHPLAEFLVVELSRGDETGVEGFDIGGEVGIEGGDALEPLSVPCTVGEVKHRFVLLARVAALGLGLGCDRHPVRAELAKIPSGEALDERLVHGRFRGEQHETLVQEQGLGEEEFDGKVLQEYGVHVPPIDPAAKQGLHFFPPANRKRRTGHPSLFESLRPSKESHLSL